jgi:hypothetical protein
LLIKPAWLNGLVFAPFLAFSWVLGSIVAMSLFAPWLGLLGFCMAFTLANYWAMVTRKRGRKRAVRVAVWGGKMGLAASAVAGYALSFLLLDKVFDPGLEPRSVLMWSAITAWGGLPLLGIVFGAARKARWETRWKRIRRGLAVGVLLGTVSGFTLAYASGLQRAADPKTWKLDLTSDGSLPSQLPNTLAARPRSNSLSGVNPTAFPGLDGPREDLWTKRTAEFEERVRRNPNDRNHAAVLGSHYLRMAQARGESRQALDWYDKAISTLEKADAPDLLFKSYRSRAAALTRLGRPSDALKDWDHALELDTWPDRAEMRLQRALTLARLGEHVRAVAEADDLHPAGKLPGAALETFARVYALAAKGCAGKDVGRKHADRALAMIALAQKAGQPLTGQRLKQDADFEALRETDEFKRLLQR